MSIKNVKITPKKSIPSYVCRMCGLKKQETHFYKSNDPINLPNGRYHTCSQCVKNNVKEDNLQKVHSLLAELNRPFITEMWKRALKSSNNTISEYLKLISASKDYRDLSYIDGDQTTRFDDKVEISDLHAYDKNGYSVTITDEIRNKWLLKNRAYSDKDILQLELFCIDMAYDYSIETASQTSMLEELSTLNLVKQKLLAEDDFTAYKKVSDAYSKTMQDAGFRPIDKKSDDKQRGLDSLGEIVAHLERDNGFITPNRINYSPDDIDRMLLYYVQWAQRFNNVSVDMEVNQHWRDDISDNDIVFDIDVEENEVDDNVI